MDKKRLIHVGVGGWGATWVPITSNSSEWEVVAWVDSDQQVLNDAVSGMGLNAKSCYTSLEKALTETPADALLAVVPPVAHAPVALAALRAGLHVMVEKPLADTMANCYAMVREAEERSLKLMVSQNYRYKRAPRTVKSILESGILGDVGWVHINFHKAPHFKSPDVKHGYTHYKLIPDMSIHHFDLMRSVLGLDPISVYANSFNPDWSWFAEDPCVTALIELDSGARVTYNANWVSRGWETTWDGDWRIQCDRGEIHWAQNRIMVKPSEIYYTVYTKNMFEREGVLEAELVSMDIEDRWYSLKEFHDSIVEDRQPETNARDNLKTVALTYAAIESSRIDARVHLDQMLRAEP